MTPRDNDDTNTTSDQRGQTVGASQYNAARDLHIGHAGDNIVTGGGDYVARDKIFYRGLTHEQVVALVVELKHADQPTVWDGRTPYLGLSAFQESDAEFFFGREDLVGELLTRVERADFVTIAGPSGSGKSSVARAGLFHALREGKLPRSETWALATMLPGNDPLLHLARALDRLAGSPGFAAELRQTGEEPPDPLLLHELAETLLTDDKRQRLVLLVDQFEELFTQTKDAVARDSFIRLLTTAAQQPDGRVKVVISLRSDFVSNVAAYDDLRQLLSQEFQLVGAMRPRDLAKAITLPSLEVGSEIDAGLVKQIIDDMKGEPGALPLMSFALQDLFEQEIPDDGPGHEMDLTLEEYLTRGGLESALERHAREVFADFSEEQKVLARSIFSKLITVGEGRLDTRRTAAFAELVPAGTDPALVAETVAVLSNESARLVTARGIEAVDDAGDLTAADVSVTIAHEKLIDAWPWLRDLVNENREAIKLQNDIAEAAQKWEKKGFEKSYLYRGGQLASAEERLGEIDVALDELSTRFMEASVAQRKASERNRILVIAGLAILALAAGIAAVLATSYAGQATDNLAVATQALIAEGTARAESETNLATSQARGTEAAEAQATAEYNEGLALTREAEAQASEQRANIEAMRAYTSALETEHQAAITQSQALAVAADAAAAERNALLAAQLAMEARRAAETGPTYDAFQRHVPGVAQPLRTLAHDYPIHGAMWSANEDLILTWSGDWTESGIGGAAHVWAVGSETPRETLVHDGVVIGATWNADESLILTWSDDNTARVWAVGSETPRETLVHDGWVNGASWNGDESLILTWSIDLGEWTGLAQVWEAGSETPRETLFHDGWVNGAMWNADESLILTWSGDFDEFDEETGLAQVWEAGHETPRETLVHDGWVNGATWNSDESLILTWSDDGTARVWPAGSETPQQTLAHDDIVIGATWNADESLILTWSNDGTARVWPAGSETPQQTLAHDDIVSGATWNADESLILTWSNDGTARVWPAGSETPQQTLAHDDIVSGATWNADEDLILTWSDDNTARVWEAGNETPRETLIHDDGVEGATWNGDENLILTWSSDPIKGTGLAHVWDTGSEAREVLIHEDWVRGAAWNGDESLILTWNGDFDGGTGLAQVWEAGSKTPRETLVHGDIVWGATWSADEDLILTWSEDGKAQVWEADREMPRETLAHGDIDGATWNADEDLILTQGGNKVFLWEAGSTTPRETLVHDGAVIGATWNADESLILTWSRDDKARVWEAGSETPRETLFHDHWVNGATWNSDESLILTWSDDNTARVWPAGSETPRETLVHDGWVNGATWNSDESLILTWSNDDGTARVWPAGSETPRETLVHDGWVNGATWNSDESLILTWSDDGTARVWPAGSETPRETLVHDGRVHGATWNADGDLILTWSWDGSARVWESATGRELARLVPDGSIITTAQWDDTESRIMVTTEGGLAVIYPLEWDALEAYACTQLPSNMSAGGWTRYFPDQPYRCSCANLPPHSDVPYEQIDLASCPLAERSDQ